MTCECAQGICRPLGGRCNGRGVGEQKGLLTGGRRSSEGQMNGERYGSDHFLLACRPSRAV